MQEITESWEHPYQIGLQSHEEKVEMFYFLLLWRWEEAFWGSQSSSSPSQHKDQVCLTPVLGEMGTERDERGNFGKCSPQMTEEMKLSLSVDGYNPPAFLLVASGMLQMLAETGRGSSNGSMEALKPFSTRYLHMGLPQGAPTAGRVSKHP